MRGSPDSSIQLLVMLSKLNLLGVNMQNCYIHMPIVHIIHYFSFYPLHLIHELPKSDLTCHILVIYIFFIVYHYNHCQHRLLLFSFFVNIVMRILPIQLINTVIIFSFSWWDHLSSTFLANFKYNIVSATIVTMFHIRSLNI